jgi:hypothetical protein
MPPSSALRPSSSALQRIVSGGQTGVDRGALDAAIELGIAHGGWCPRGRLAEDGVVPSQYQLRETESADYDERTRRNVLDSDGTLILHRGPLIGGTQLTRQFAVETCKPWLCVDLSHDPDPAIVRRWLAEHHVATLNVAGPRESTAPGIHAEARRFLLELCRPSPGARAKEGV